MDHPSIGLTGTIRLLFAIAKVADRGYSLERPGQLHEESLRFDNPSVQ